MPRISLIIPAYNEEQYLPALLARGVRTISSARKFDRHGDWHWFAILARGIGWFLFDREKFRQFARAYWYDDAR